MRKNHSVGADVARLLIGAVSAGWLIPLWLAAQHVKMWCEQDLIARIPTGIPITSYPLLDPAMFWLSVAMTWLALTIVAWVFFWRALTRAQ